MTTVSKRRSSILLSLAGFSIVPTLGIACFRLSAWTLYSSSIGAAEPHFLFISRILQFLAIILLVAIDRHVSYSAIQFYRFVGAGAVFMAIGAGLFLAGEGDTVRLIGCGLNGAGSAVLMLAWGYVFCSLDSRLSTLGLSLGFAVYASVTWLLAILPPQIIIMLIALFPLLSYLCLKLFPVDSMGQTDTQYRLPEKGFSRIPKDIFSVLVICTVISILAKLLVPLDTVSSLAYHVIWPSIIILIFLFYAVWILILKRRDQNMLWPIYVLVIFSGLLCYTSLATSQPAFASAFFRATQECFVLFCWVATASVVNKAELPRMLAFGLSALLFLTPQTLVSSSLAMLFPSTQMPDFSMLTIGILSAMAFVLIVASVALIMSNSIRDTARSHKDRADKQAPHSPGGVEAVVDEYDLTKREGEILTYIMRGYTFPHIANTLFLSLDTVRSHAKNIYRKTGVNKKEQLIAIVEEREGPPRG